MNVIFFNNWHNGDIHISRSLVKHITQNFDPGINKFYYAHGNPKLLQDIPNLTEDSSLLNKVKDCHIECFGEGQNLYLNTWYLSGNSKYYNKYGITFDTIYSLFESHCKRLRLQMPGLTESFSSI